MKPIFTKFVLTVSTALSFCMVSSSLAQTAVPKNVSKVSIAVVPNLVKFDVTRFDVTVGSEVEVNFSNPCVLPHNFVLVQPEAEAALTAAVGAMGLEGMEKHFLPDVPGIVAATRLLQPGKKETLRFNAPETPGEYPYVCTFPGHWFTMRGVMRVVKAGQKLSTAIKSTTTGPQVPDALRDSGMTHKPLGTMEKPFVMRSFVPDPGLDPAVFANHSRATSAVRYDPNTRQDILEKKKDPATGEIVEVPIVVPTQPGIAGAIAVNHGKDFSYVWDSTECRLMYAWRGGFLDMNWYWGKEPGSGRPKIYIPKLMGAMVYRASGKSPTSGVADEVPKFGGYRMVQNMPEFWYRIGKSTIRERIAPAAKGGFELKVRVEGAPREWRVLPADRDIVDIVGVPVGPILGDFTVRVKDRPEPAFPDEPFEPTPKKK